MTSKITNYFSFFLVVFISLMVIKTLLIVTSKNEEVAVTILPVSHTALLNLLYEYPQLSPVFTSEPNNTKPKASTWRFEELKYLHMATLFRKQNRK